MGNVDRRVVGFGVVLGLAVLLAVAVQGSGGGDHATGSTMGIWEGRQGAVEERAANEPALIGASREVSGSRSAEGVEVAPVQSDFAPRGSKVLVEAGVAGCGRQPPRIDRISVLERESSVVLTTYVARAQPAEQKGEVCPDEELLLTETVELEEPVGSRSLYDGVRWPPIRRWPSRGR